MASELQNIVDELASGLDAPTVLEDHKELVDLHPYPEAVAQAEGAGS
jgi:hypothetical protein